MRNPKKQAVEANLKSMACYLMKSDDPATDKQRRGSRGTTRIDKDTPRVRVWRHEAVRWPRRHSGAMQARAWCGEVDMGTGDTVEA